MVACLLMVIGLLVVVGLSTGDWFDNGGIAHADGLSVDSFIGICHSIAVGWFAWVHEYCSEGSAFCDCCWKCRLFCVCLY